MNGAALVLILVRKDESTVGTGVSRSHTRGLDGCGGRGSRKSGREQRKEKRESEHDCHAAVANQRLPGSESWEESPLV